VTRREEPGKQALRETGGGERDRSLFVPSLFFPRFFSFIQFFKDPRWLRIITGFFPQPEISREREGLRRPRTPPRLIPLSLSFETPSELDL